MKDPYGIAIQNQLRQISGHEGVPDFVFRPVDLPKGQAQREIGDFLLWAGEIMAVVSVKSRSPERSGTDTESRKRSWLDKHISRARGQIQGVVRTLSAAPAGTISLESERGVRVPWDPAAVAYYIGVVVVDVVPPISDYAPSAMNAPVPTIAMLAEDWDFLHQVLPSTTAVIRYAANRQRHMPACPLGSEPDVLGLLVEQDNTGKDIMLPKTGLPKDHFEQIVGAHPDWFFGTQRDDRFAFVIDAMIEGAAADADPAFSEVAAPTDYMNIVRFLDQIPLLPRVKIGKDIIERCRRVGEKGGRDVGRYAVPHGLIVFVADDAERVDRATDIRSLTLARHSQALDAGAPRSLATLGIATEPIPTNARSHDFIYIEGGIRSDAEFRAERDNLFGAPDFEPLVEYWTRRGS